MSDAPRTADVERQADARERWTSVTPSAAASPRSRRLGDPPRRDAVLDAADAVDGESSSRPRTLIMDVAGAYMRPAGGWFPVAALVELMAQLGVDDQATRSAVSRITKRGLLAAETRAGVRGYRLTDLALPRLADAERRIFDHRGPAELADGWVLVSFSVPEHERDKRHQLRSRLEWLGFGNLSSGLWLAPARTWPALQDDIERMAMDKYVTAFRADHLGLENLPDLVQRCWDLGELRVMYDDFLTATEPLQRRWARRRREPHGEQAFLDYTLTLYRWRKFPYLDPGLPTGVLPPGWEGARAARLFFGLHERLAPAAHAHVHAVVTG